MLKQLTKDQVILPKDQDEYDSDQDGPSLSDLEGLTDLENQSAVETDTGDDGSSTPSIPNLASTSPNLPISTNPAKMPKDASAKRTRRQEDTQVADIKRWRNYQTAELTSFQDEMDYTVPDTYSEVPGSHMLLDIFISIGRYQGLLEGEISIDSILTPSIPALALGVWQGMAWAGKLGQRMAR